MPVAVSRLAERLAAARVTLSVAHGRGFAHVRGPVERLWPDAGRAAGGL